MIPYYVAFHLTWLGLVLGFINFELEPSRINRCILLFNVLCVVVTYVTVIYARSYLVH